MNKERIPLTQLDRDIEIGTYELICNIIFWVFNNWGMGCYLVFGAFSQPAVESKKNNSLLCTQHLQDCQSYRRQLVWIDSQKYLAIDHKFCLQSVSRMEFKFSSLTVVILSPPPTYPSSFAYATISISSGLNSWPFDHSERPDLLGWPDHSWLWKRTDVIKMMLMMCKRTCRGERLEAKGSIRNLFEVIIV